VPKLRSLLPNLKHSVDEAADLTAGQAAPQPQGHGALGATGDSSLDGWLEQDGRRHNLVLPPSQDENREAD